MGVALIGVGTALGYPEVMTAGAVVSGAYFGDKMSPLSDTTNLAPAMAGATLFGHIKHMIYTTGTSLIIALVAYGVMGFMFSSSNTPDLSVIEEVSDFIQGSSRIGLVALIPPLFVICAVAMKLPALPSLVGGVFIGVPLMFWNKTAVEAALVSMERDGGIWGNIFNILNNGIHMGQVPEGASSIIEELSGLLGHDGAQDMFWTISIILAAMCFGGIVDSTGIMGTIATLLLKVAKGRGGLVLATEVMCIFVNAICCDQYLALVLPGRMFKEKFEDMRLKPENLSRCLEDSRYYYFQLLPLEYLRRYHEKFPGRRQWIYSLCNLELAESSRIYNLRFHRHHYDEDDRRRICTYSGRKRKRKERSSGSSGSLIYLLQKQIVFLDKIKSYGKEAVRKPYSFFFIAYFKML